MSATHARQRFPRLAALLGYREDRPARPVATVGLRDSGVPASPAPQPVAGPAREHPEWGPPPEPAGQRPPWRGAPEPGRLTGTGESSPVHMCPDEGGVMPCCGLTPFEVPAADRMTLLPQLVTCRTSAHDTASDNPPPHDRPYVPEDEQSETAAEAYMPRFPADLRDLPVFRTVARSHGWAPAGLVRMRAAS